LNAGDCPQGPAPKKCYSCGDVGHVVRFSLSFPSLSPCETQELIRIVTLLWDSHESALKTLTLELLDSERDKLRSNKVDKEEVKVLVTDVDNPVTSLGNALNLSVEEDVSLYFLLVECEIEEELIEFGRV